MFPKVMWILWYIIAWVFQNLFLVQAFRIENGRVLCCMASKLGCHQDILLQAGATSVSHLLTNQALVAPCVQCWRSMCGLLAWPPCFWRAGAMKDHVKKQNQTPKLPKTSLSPRKAEGPSRVGIQAPALPEIFSTCTSLLCTGVALTDV